jgi:Smg protein
MKESVLDVLMYLFENYTDNEFNDVERYDGLRDELIGAGFPEEEVAHAFAWLDGLADRRGVPSLAGSERTLRVYARREQVRLSAECRGFLLYLEQLGILLPQARELVIDRLMAIEDEIDLERVKWVLLLVLMNQPGHEDAYEHMQDLVYYEGDYLH